MYLSHNKGYDVNNLNMLINGGFTFLVVLRARKTTQKMLLYFDLIPDSGVVKVNDFHLIR